MTAINSASVTYDANQNATSITGNTYGYDAANRLTSATPSGGSAASFVFDPLSRLASSTVSSTTTRYQYAGVQLAAEYDASGAVTRRYVPGLGLDGVVTAYTGSGFTTRDWLLADERGSVVALTGSTGAVSTINRYDEYGTPHTGNAGRFGYTGQAWMAEAGAWNYRARAYLPGMGRFLQTDPIGYVAGMNLYAYVGADPVNFRDPTGLFPGEEISRAECFLRHGRVIPSPTGEGLDHCVPDISFSEMWDRMYEASIFGPDGGGSGGGPLGTLFRTIRQSCPVAEVGGALGALIEGRIGARGIVSALGALDAGSIRGRFGWNGEQGWNGGLFFGQRAALDLSIGVPDTPYGATLGAEYGREQNLLNGEPLPPAGFVENDFLGLDFGAGAFFAPGARVGIDLNGCD